MELWVLIPITVAFAVLVILARNELVRRTLICPLKKTTGEVDIIQRRQEPTKPVRVKSCSLLPNPNRVDCSQACLHQAG